MDGITVGDEVNLIVNENVTEKNGTAYINNYLVSINRKLTEKEQQEVDKVMLLKEATAIISPLIKILFLKNLPGIIPEGRI